MRNCVVNNNTNTDEATAIVNCPADKLTMEHVTIVNNIGAAVTNENVLLTGSSFSKGNTRKNSIDEKLATTGADGAANFANPTNGRGATLGFDTYLGGYSSFRPLTSSADAATHIINKGASTALAADIMGNERNLGGVPDLGAYEADLPRKGTVIYVRDYGVNDTSTDGRDGSSWDSAINGRANYGNNDGIDNDHINNNVYNNNNNFITGLQYAVNQAYLQMVKRNANGGIAYQTATVANDKGGGSKTVTYPVLDGTYWNDGAKYGERIQIWVGAGEYKSNAGLFMRDGVDVFGGFPASGYPAMNERNPRIAANETKLMAGIQGPQLHGDGDSGGNYYDLNNGYDNANTTRRVLTQPMPYYGQGENGLDVERTNKEVTGFKATTTWNGFTIQGGRTQINHQREGGAGVALRQNGVLENCVIKDNVNTVTSSGRGGAIFCNGGTLINCRIEGNELKRSSGNRAVFGGGIYLRYGTTFNCVYSGNILDDGAFKDGLGLGSAIYIERGNFFNNTVTANTGSIALAIGKYFQESQLNLINCIIYGNEHPYYQYNNIPANSVQVIRLQQSGLAPLAITNCCIPEEGIKYGKDGTYVNDRIIYNFRENEQTNLTINGRITSSPMFTADDNGDYSLAANSPCVNAGKSDGLENEGMPVELPETDMDYTARIKDCTVDIGAYERDNQDNTQPEKYDMTRTYYVTQNGAGTSSGNSLANAACADKLQTVLNAAGELKRNNLQLDVVVKVAGYESFVYHANTLADDRDPVSYSYVIPCGIRVEGGYSDEDNDWSDDGSRDVMRYKTVLSAIKQATETTQAVNGYHTVTFEELPEGWTGGETVIDGLWLTDGSATSLAGAGNPNTRGGGAIVPAGAHVRNCIVEGCEAIDGGGLYLLPGATVSGTAVLGNSADNGGGIYADNTGADADSRAHIISCTIADNTADDGGGLYLEDGAAMSVNTVSWGTDAPSGRNVSGVGTERFADTRLARVFVGVNEGSYYPFNDCFIESQEMPSDFENASMTGDSTLYFADSYRRLKEFSPLIKHGVSDAYQDALATEFGISAQDVQNIDRSQQLERIDAGAFAYDGGVLPTELFTRLFVSQTANVKLKDESKMMDYLGRTFYTSFSTLEDALSYIRGQRETNPDAEFEILMAGGTYKPATQRITSVDVPYDQRLYSFSIPHGVSIYGGFSGMELISSDDVSRIERADGSPLTLTPDGNIDKIINARTYSDFNQNGIDEAWELANQTILSGNINVSADAQNVYHVIFTDAKGVDDPKPVVLDGLTVMNGETSNVLSEVSQSNEQGRGGGIYSDGVGYTLSRCRLINNFGLRGGAVFVRDARLNVIGSIFAGNGWTPGMKQPTTPENQPARGGAVFMAGISSSDTQLYAVNSLFVNNETVGEGGAIGTNYAEGITGNVDPLLSIMNCTFARNKAATNAVLYNHNGKSSIVNTLIWGNESEAYADLTDPANVTISHSASDHDYAGKFADGSGNILLAASNADASGPRFTNPPAVAGVSGNDATNLWNPAAISVATDAGDGLTNASGTVSGAYDEWFGYGDDELVAYRNQYMGKYMGNADYERYSGPVDPGTGITGDRPIDIGAYEYQYVSNFRTMLAIYVATEDAGNRSGDSWANATSDLRGAIAGASNPDQNEGARTIYVRNGNYSLPRLSAGQAYVLTMSDNNLSDSLTIKGSCTGVAHTQDFANQTVVRNHPNATDAENLLNVNANKKDVVVEGFTFINSQGRGVMAATAQGGTFTMKNGALRANGGDGMQIGDNKGSVLIYNTLFADNAQAGLTPKGTTTLVNTTFANNGSDLSDLSALPVLSIYNTVSWNNKTNNISSSEDNHNRAFGLTGNDEAARENNEDIEKGPNFRDPLNADVEGRDYRIRPSLTLLNKGGNRHYTDNVPGLADGSIPDSERDLAGNPRLTDGTIDIGAYEYEAPLRPIIYVKADVVADDADGSSWAKALDDLQGAADLAGIYANNNQGESGYVFVHSNIDGQSLRLTLPNTKVYGGMNDEQTTAISQADDGSWTGVAEAVGGLLSARSGLLERSNHTGLRSVAVTAANAVADGFEVTGNASVTNGYLSTSIVNGNVNGVADGILYNTLVYGVVKSVKAVNVTAKGAITAADGSANNRGNATETNDYVADEHWQYQLMETSADIDDGTDSAATKACIAAVGHSRDIAGNLRIRNAVDNGCFETWDINYDNAAVTDEDYPHGQSVVYVRRGKELLLRRDYAAATPFCPGVLLLEHRAGLRGNGKNIGLGNVIVERNVAANSIDMAYVPFEVSDFVNTSAIPVKYYDGAARAAYDYTFDSADGKAWTDATAYGRTGLLIDNSQGQDEACVRFVGKGNNVYTEGPDMNAPKQVTLAYNNFNEPWATPADGGNRFTHKENMSWNLFGSPYLCAMNYDDMEYGRVIYGHNGSNYVTLNTTEANENGYIPAGDAVFTQTATLKSAGETFDVAQPDEVLTGEPYGGMAALQLSVAAAGGTRAAEIGGSDVLQLNAVEAASARTDFDPSADGVKWMADSTAQIFAARGSGRYSLLSAVNREGAVSVGLSLPEAGMYTIALPDDCSADGYEAVVLHDAATGRTADLLEGGYDFSVTEGGEVSGRFSVSFRRMADDRMADDIRIWSPATATVAVSGLADGDVVRVFSASGVLAAQGVAAGSTLRLAAPVSGVAVVEVVRGEESVKTGKIRMKN